MRRIFFGAGILALVPAMLMWSVAPGIAADRGHAEHGHVEQGHAEHGHVEYNHAAGVGSVHFGPREAPVHVGPAPRAAYRNPYRDDYFRRFPAGYRPFVFNGAQYYGYYSLPVGCQQVVLNGILYYLCGGVYYQPYIYGGQTVYLVMPTPG